MTTASLKKVRLFTLADIAPAWSKELRLREDLVLRELRLGVINVERVRAGQSWIAIEDIPEPEKLPPADSRVDRLWLETFCNKQEWALPRFLFPSELGEHRPGRGRPSYPHKTSIIEELHRRAESGDLAPTLAEEAAYLQRWAGQQFREPPPSVKSLTNRLADQYRGLKS